VLCLCCKVRYAKMLNLHKEVNTLYFGFISCGVSTPRTVGSQFSSLSGSACWSPVFKAYLKFMLVSSSQGFAEVRAGLQFSKPSGSSCWSPVPKGKVRYAKMLNLHKEVNTLYFGFISCGVSTPRTVFD
jgi:hypothetical protein